MTTPDPTPDRIPPDPDDRRCMATTRGGDRCAARRVPGVAVCAHHGGASAESITAGQRRIAATDPTITALAGDVGDGPNVTPIDTLLAATRRAHAVMDAAAAELATIPRSVYRDANGKIHLHPLVRRHDAAVDLAARVSAAGVRAGVDVARLELDRQRADLLGRALVWVFTTSGVDVDDAVRGRIAHALRAIDAGLDPAVVPVGSVGDDTRPGDVRVVRGNRRSVVPHDPALLPPGRGAVPGPDDYGD